MAAHGLGTSVGSGAPSEAGGMLAGGWACSCHTLGFLEVGFLASVIITFEQWRIWGLVLSHRAELLPWHRLSLCP